MSKKLSLKEININNFVQVDLKDAKEKLAAGEKLKPLLIDLEFSASGKVINRRIYPPAGHRNGLKSWTAPYEKPVLIHHDSSKDPIGRVKSVRWEDTEKEALDFLGGDINALAQIKKAFATNDGKVIRKTMKKYGALSDSWPGLGRVVGKVKVVDLDAVQKFIDERYLTFSAGQGTDSWQCMSCNSDWQAGDICDHRPGTLDEDGEPVLFLCGNMHGREISVEHQPANDTSIALSMAFEDSEGHETEFTLNLMDSNVTSTSVADFESEFNMEIKDLMDLEFKTALDLLMKEETLAQFQDALSGDSVFEINWLIKIHDALHSMYDFELKWKGESDDLQLPAGVFKLHGMLHDIADQKGFRDSIVNGYLDSFSMEGVESGEYKLVSPTTTDTKIFDESTLVDSIISRLKAEIFNGQNEKEKEEVLDLPVDDESIDWVLMDLALSAEVGDAKLSLADKAKLDDSCFCGPDRKFGISDLQHVEAAKKIVVASKLSEDSKTNLLASIERKAQRILPTPVESDSKYDALVLEHNNLTKDYTNALTTVEDLTTKLLEVGKTLITKVDPNKNIDQIKLDELLDWFSNIVVSNNIEDKEEPVLPHPAGEIKPLEDSTPQKLSLDTLSGYEKNVINRYREMVAEDNKLGAQKLLRSCRSLLPDNFNPEDYE